MLFSKDELNAFLEQSQTKYQDEGYSKADITKLTRRDFGIWLDDLKTDLKEQILSNSLLDPKGKKDRVLKAEFDFEYFARTYFPHYFSIDGACALHKDLSATFEKISSSKSGDKYAYAAPRGHAKTTYCSQLFPLWCICFNKKKFIVEISDSVELVEACLEAIKTELEDNANLKMDFPNVCGISKNWKIGEFISKNGVKLKAFGSGKRLRGIKYGVYRPDLAILDDLENDTNVRSKEQRDKLEAWLDEAVLNLGSVDGSLDVLYIGTILHTDSVLARKLKLKFWNAKKYQSIIEYPKRMDLWEEWSNIYKNVSRDASDEYYIRRKSLMDEGSVVLWQEALNILKLMQKRAENLKSFNKEQQNDPRSETQIFTKESLHFYKELPKIDYFVMYIDPAGEKKKSDYTAITVLGVDKKEAKIYIAESIVAVMKTKKTIKEIIRLHQVYKCRVLAIETNGGQEFFRGWIRDKAFDLGVKLPLKGVNNVANKGLRIEELEVPIDDGEILFHKSQTLLISQLLEYPEAKNDDAPDSLAGAYSLTKLAKNRARRRL
ncbi:putative phage protein [Campylobacter pinnipediorum subsp. caledonicus]|uniref:Putative phage protein n=1 Tax=Campylobacter pinnipediorum subsp. caledonicus TaxID=1874362 RepID=A0A1S6U876_9BACT|nr:phage terminase large subunit [Campylobacter pinnipediorum]AQW87885.1 putative phage protein [Campylobacter pinnipediorum subsp. caledonicus]